MNTEAKKNTLMCKTLQTSSEENTHLHHELDFKD